VNNITKWENLNFKIEGERHEVKSKYVEKLRHEREERPPGNKKLIVSSYDIKFEASI
jgi:hypothetical protein